MPDETEENAQSPDSVESEPTPEPAISPEVPSTSEAETAVSEPEDSEPAERSPGQCQSANIQAKNRRKYGRG